MESNHQQSLMILNEYFDMKMRKMYESVVCGCVETLFLFEKKISERHGANAPLQMIEIISDLAQYC